MNAHTFYMRFTASGKPGCYGSAGECGDLCGRCRRICRWVCGYCGGIGLRESVTAKAIVGFLETHPGEIKEGSEGFFVRLFHLNKVAKRGGNR